MRAIEIPVLHTEYKVIVIFGDPVAVNRVLKRQGHTYTLHRWRDRGLCYYEPGTYPVIAMPKVPTQPDHLGTLAHEAVHAVEAIFNHINHEFVYGGEIFAHCVGAIVRETLLAIKQQNARNKSNSKDSAKRKLPAAKAAKPKGKGSSRAPR